MKCVMKAFMCTSIITVCTKRSSTDLGAEPNKWNARTLKGKIKKPNGRKSNRRKFRTVETKERSCKEGSHHDCKNSQEKDPSY